MDGGQGWEKHQVAKKWLRKFRHETSDYIFFYMPNETLWTQTPNGGFMCTDAYHSALSAFISKDRQALMRTCLLNWQNQVQVVLAWRKRLGVLSSANAHQSPPAHSEVSAAFPVRTAFRTPSSRRVSKCRSASPAL